MISYISRLFIANFDRTFLDLLSNQKYSDYQFLFKKTFEVFWDYFIFRQIIILLLNYGNPQKIPYKRVPLCILY